MRARTLVAAPTLLAILVCASVACAQDIHAAVREDSPDKIREALAAGADINLIGPGGQTPLMHGVLSGKVAAVKFLLEQGANYNIGEKDGYTPMHGAGFQGRGEIAKLLIEHGLDPNDRHSDGFTPLHRACWGNEPRHTEMVRVLLEAGVPHDQPAKDGTKPIEMAKQNAKTRKLLKRWAKKPKTPKAASEL